MMGHQNYNWYLKQALKRTPQEWVVLMKKPSYVITLSYLIDPVQPSVHKMDPRGDIPQAEAEM